MKKFYVSGKYKSIDIGCTVESKNIHLAAIDFYYLFAKEMTVNNFKKSDFEITEIEEVRNEL